MAAFIDLAYYQDTYKGAAIPADSFYRYAERASAAVEFQTFGRSSVIIAADTDAATIDKIQMATCAAAEALYNADQQASGASGTVASERVGDHSVNYAVSQDAMLTTDAKVSSAMREYLAFTGLMFRGFE
jgi:hypothetical protein